LSAPPLLGGVFCSFEKTKGGSRWECSFCLVVCFVSLVFYPGIRQIEEKVIGDREALHLLNTWLGSMPKNTRGKTGCRLNLL